MTIDLSDIDRPDILDDEDETAEEEIELVPRLCNEIQLFDLCEIDPSRCSFRDGRFCTDIDMLRAFEGEPEPEDDPDPSLRGTLDLDDDVMYDDEEGIESDGPSRLSH